MADDPHPIRSAIGDMPIFGMEGRAVAARDLPTLDQLKSHPEILEVALEVTARDGERAASLDTLELLVRAILWIDRAHRTRPREDELKT